MSENNELDYKGVTLTGPVKYRWRVGVVIKGSSRATKNFKVTIPVPNDWPEQIVQLYQEDIPPEIESVNYRGLNSNVRQLVATIPKINANQLIAMTVTLMSKPNKSFNPPTHPFFAFRNACPAEIKDYLESVHKFLIAMQKSEIRSKN